MIKPRQTSVVVLVTLAELAWLAAFGLLFAYRGKVGELGRVRHQLSAANTELTQWRTNSPDAAKLLDDLKTAIAEKSVLQTHLAAFTRQLQGKSPEEVSDLLTTAEQASKRIAESETMAKRLAGELKEKNEEIARIHLQLLSTNSALAELRRKWDALPPDASELAERLRQATNAITIAESEQVATRAQISWLSNRVGQLEYGEVAIRRELIGLPTNELRRVVFIVDTSSSMRNSPAWIGARKLMRSWVEYLSVEECALVTFNDRAVAFPPTGYLRLRDRGSGSLSENKLQLLAAFDNSAPGTYSDLLDGLRLAYKRPNPDLIILFTDGHPHVSTKMDASYGKLILREVSNHSSIPILAVAVGSYEVEGVGGPAERRNAAIAFLKQLADQTGGSFIGR